MDEPTQETPLKAPLSVPPVIQGHVDCHRQDEERDLIVADLRAAVKEMRSRPLTGTHLFNDAQANALEAAADRYELGAHRNGGE